MSDDIQPEPIKGLPERPPKGEDILWQGKPKTWALARDSLSIHWVMGWFGLLAFWRFGTLADQVPLTQALWAGSMFIVIGLMACAILLGLTWVQASLTMYTITTARVVMRVGAALTLTVNLPYRQIANASLDQRRDGTGTIALELIEGKTRLSYLVMWPHVRPWYFQTQPALRCIPEAENVAAILAEAADTRLSMPVVARNNVAVAAE